MLPHGVIGESIMPLAEEHLAAAGHQDRAHELTVINVRPEGLVHRRGRLRAQVGRKWSSGEGQKEAGNQNPVQMRPSTHYILGCMTLVPHPYGFQGIYCSKSFKKKLLQ